MKTERLFAALFGATVLAGCLCAQVGAASQKQATGKTSVAGSRPSLLNPATLKAQAPDMYKVKFNTTKGDFVVQVTRAWSPLGADRFYNLAKNGFTTARHSSASCLVSSSSLG